MTVRLRVPFFKHKWTVDSGFVVAYAVVSFAVCLVLYSVASVIRHISPINKWFSSSSIRESGVTRPGMHQATVSPAYPLAALIAVVALFLYFSRVSSDWMDIDEAGSTLDSQRVNHRIGLQDRRPGLWGENSALRLYLRETWAWAASIECSEVAQRAAAQVQGLAGRAYDLSIASWRKDKTD